MEKFIDAIKLNITLLTDKFYLLKNFELYSNFYFKKEAVCKKNFNIYRYLLYIINNDKRLFKQAKHIVSDSFTLDRPMFHFTRNVKKQTILDNEINYYMHENK